MGGELLLAVAMFAGASGTFSPTMRYQADTYPVDVATFSYVDPAHGRCPIDMNAAGVVTSPSLATYDPMARTLTVRTPLDRWSPALGCFYRDANVTAFGKERYDRLSNFRWTEVAFDR